MLKVRELCAFYGEVQVLWEVSFSISAKEIVAIVGPNGAGKTTTINGISGIIRTISGEVIFNNQSIIELPPHEIVELGISQIPEGRRLFSEMTVLENLELGAYGKRARERKEEAIQGVFDMFPILSARKNQLAGTLSGGEQQMLAIGRGLMSRPILLMIDEPSLGLSPLLVEELFKTIQRLNTQGLTVLLIEQNVHQALSISHRAYVLEVGKIMLQGRGQELLGDDYVREAYLGI